jgi:hypothetical protein
MPSGYDDDAMGGAAGNDASSDDNGILLGNKRNAAQDE